MDFNIYYALVAAFVLLSFQYTGPVLLNLDTVKTSSWAKLAKGFSMFFDLFIIPIAILLMIILYKMGKKELDCELCEETCKKGCGK